jgi:cystathionine gamma-synthase
MARSFETMSVHAGEPRDKAHDSLVTPIILSTAYPFTDTDELHRYFRGEHVRGEEYGRYGNPTQEVAEAKLAALDGGGAALLTSTGMSALVTTLLAMVRPGMHLVITGDSYRKTRVFVREFLAKFGVEHTSCEPSVEGIAAALRPNTRLIITESPTNPYLNCIDLEALAALARDKRVKTLIDATLATPYNLQPLSFGIDLVVHSATKYLGGHNDLMAGVVVGKSDTIQAIREHQGMFGALASPFTAYMLIRGLKTFAVRMRHQNASGQCIAEFLEAHPKIERVLPRPGQPSRARHRQEANARLRQPDQLHCQGQPRRCQPGGRRLRDPLPGAQPGRSRIADRAAGTDELLRQVAGGAWRPRHPREPSAHERRPGER